MLLVILTLFPDALEPYLGSSILGIAQEKGLVRVRLVDFRDFTRDRHRTVDDRPFGGGPGMVLRPEPIIDAVEWLEREHGPFRRILLTPDGEPFDQPRAAELAREERVLLLCGRYEGFDERVRRVLAWEEISVGDYVLAGGELPALVVTEAAARLVPGVLGDERSACEDSFQPVSDPSAQAGDADREVLLDHPHYTRPRVYRGHAVPPVLLTGDHAAIARWRRAEARARTRERRPDLPRNRPDPTD